MDQNDNNYKLRDWVIYAGCNNGQYYGSSCGWINVYYNSNFRSTNSSTLGFSGGPIMLKSNNNIVGVVHGTDGNNNCWGVRITEDMIALIKELNGN